LGKSDLQKLASRCQPCKQSARTFSEALALDRSATTPQLG